MFKGLTVLLIVLNFLFLGCHKKDDSHTITSETAPPLLPAPEAPETPEVPETPETPQGSIDPRAGKVTLWDRSSGYDCAVFLPADYGINPNKDYPMILSLHGLNGSVLNTNHTAVGGNKTGFIKQVWGTELAKTYKAIVIAPNWAQAGSTGSGLWTHSLLRQLIIDAKETYQIDQDRIVVTGLSAGSIATQELVRNSKDLIAAAMPGAYENTFTNVCQLADLPIWVFGNTSDSLFKYTGWEATEPKVESCDNFIHEFTLTVYNNSCGHGCWDSHWAKPEVQEWLINQSK